jgi:MFS transporter, Spinster family, sphingosine-1-phosphate transporter
VIEGHPANGHSGADQDGPRAPRYALYALGVVAAASFLSNFDNAVLPVVAARIQADFHISDTQIGALIGAFTVALALGGMPIGYWADRWSRRTILGLGLVVWSLATLVTGFTRAFPQMLAVRAVLGVGEATANPVGASLIGDYFSRRARGRAMATVALAINLGVGVGSILAGVIGLHFGWRWAFYLAAGPGLLLAILAFTLREPLRGAAEARGPRLAVARDSGLGAFARLLRIRTYVATLAAMAATSVALGSFQFIALYLHRRFGVNIAQAGALLGIPILLGALIGTPSVGWLLDWRGRRSVQGPVEVGAVATLVCGLATVVMFTAQSLTVFEAAMVAFVLPSAAAIVAPFVVFQNVVVPSLRASAASMANTIVRLVGFALGPLAVGFVSDLAHHDLGLSLLLLVPTGLLLASASMALAVGSMKQDVAAMEQKWALKETGKPPLRGASGLGAEPAPAAVNL